MSGLLLLGEKLSDEPYSPQDVSLLESLAVQLGIAHENASLKRRVESQEWLHRELMISLEREGVQLMQECPSCHRCFDHTASTCPDDGSTLRASVPVERVIEARYRRPAAGGTGPAASRPSSRLLPLGRPHDGGLGRSQRLRTPSWIPAQRVLAS